jgi:hypothetical protein
MGALLLTFGMTLTAQAADETADATALINAVDSPPNIECSWILPDMQPGNGTTPVDVRWPDATLETLNVGTVEYIPSNLSDVHDDDPNLAPTPWPCFVPTSSGAATAKPSFNGTTESLVTIKPNLENLPEERAIEMWMAVDHANGISNISDVYWKIYHPDGTFKLQVHGTKVPLADCAAYGTGTGPVAAGQSGMFEAASHSGQVQPEAIDDINWGMIALCQQEVKAFYHVTWPLSKDQQCGVYRAEATAVSASGAIVKQNTYFDVPCIYALQVDFTTVNWGGITPGLTKVLAGNLIWGDNIPTVKNVGNDGMGLKIEFTQLVGAAEAKVITVFDAKYGRSPATLFTVDPIAANTETDLVNGPDQILCANELGKLDLSVHPGFGLPSDSYEGEVYLTGYHIADECLGSEHIT